MILLFFYQTKVGERKQPKTHKQRKQRGQLEAAQHLVPLSDDAVRYASNLQHDAHEENQERHLGLALGADAPPKHAQGNNADFSRRQDDLPKIRRVVVSREEQAVPDLDPVAVQAAFEFAVPSEEEQHKKW